MRIRRAASRSRRANEVLEHGTDHLDARPVQAAWFLNSLRRFSRRFHARVSFSVRFRVIVLLAIRRIDRRNRSNRDRMEAPRFSPILERTEECVGASRKAKVRGRRRTAALFPEFDKQRGARSRLAMNK